MSAAELAPSQEIKGPTDAIAPPLGATAIAGVKGSADVHSPFSDQFPGYAKLNGYDTPITRTSYNTHFMALNRSGEPTIVRQNSADILNTLQGRLETESMLRSEGRDVQDRRFALFLDAPEQNFLNNVSFVGWEERKVNNTSARPETNAVFVQEALPDDGQLSLETSLAFISIPFKEIVAVRLAYDPEKDLTDRG
jgi:hypothetical protein